MNNKNDNMKKKIATGILIGTSITGIASSAVLATNTTNIADDEVANSVNQSVSVASERTTRRNKKDDKKMIPSEPAKAPERYMNTQIVCSRNLFSHRGSGYQKGLQPNKFQSFCINGYAYNYFGYISSVTQKDFTVYTKLFKVGEKLYYADEETGNIKTGLQTIGNDLYYFSEDKNDPCAQTGWYRDGETQYYFDKYGKAVKGFKKFGSDITMYFDNKGKRVQEIDITPSGDIYYYEKGSKTPFTGGWKTIGNDTFYFDKDSGGKAVRNTKKQIGPFTYEFNEYGIRTPNMWGVVK